ncbi:MAG: hypothetical protein OEY86_06975 [Nitrospira sp.]|nr:hypothetical protein [Nitrospira sp.]
MRGKITVLTLCVSLVWASIATAIDIDHNCNPRGWVNQLKAWWDPITFWSARPAAIEDELKRDIKAYQVYLVQRQADEAIAIVERRKRGIEQAALEETLRIMEVQPKPLSPEARRKSDESLERVEEVLAENHAFVDTVRRQMLERAINWSERCTTFSHEQLSKLRR